MSEHESHSHSDPPEKSLSGLYLTSSSSAASSSTSIGQMDSTAPNGNRPLIPYNPAPAGGVNPYFGHGAVPINPPWPVPPPGFQLHPHALQGAAQPPQGPVHHPQDMRREYVAIPIPAEWVIPPPVERPKNTFTDDECIKVGRRISGTFILGDVENLSVVATAEADDQCIQVGRRLSSSFIGDVSEISIITTAEAIMEAHAHGIPKSQLTFVVAGFSNPVLEEGLKALAESRKGFITRERFEWKICKGSWFHCAQLNALLYRRVGSPVNMQYWEECLNKILSGNDWREVPTNVCKPNKQKIKK